MMHNYLSMQVHSWSCYLTQSWACYILQSLLCHVSYHYTMATLIRMMIVGTKASTATQPTVIPDHMKVRERSTMKEWAI